MVCQKEEEIKYETSQDEKENDDYDGTSCGCDDTRRRQLFIGCGAAHTGGDQYDGNNADVGGGEAGSYTGIEAFLFFRMRACIVPVKAG